MASDPAPSFEVGRQVKPGSMVRTPPVWAVLTGPYALFLLFLLIVPLANVALFSIQRYSPKRVALPELTFDNYHKLADLYYLRLFARTFTSGYPLAYWLARALAVASSRAVSADCAAYGQRGDPRFRLDRHPPPQGARKRGFCWRRCGCFTPTPPS